MDSSINILITMHATCVAYLRQQPVQPKVGIRKKLHGNLTAVRPMTIQPSNLNIKACAEIHFLIDQLTVLKCSLEEMVRKVPKTIIVTVANVKIKPTRNQFLKLNLILT